MSADTLSRDARHLALPQIGAEGQHRISGGTALLIGIGGIGCAAATYLVSSGIGQLLLCDFDTVDETNLGRQVLYGPGDIGRRKAELAAARLQKVNPAVEITSIAERLTAPALRTAVEKSDVVLDGCDNFATKRSRSATRAPSQPTAKRTQSASLGSTSPRPSSLRRRGSPADCRICHSIRRPACRVRARLPRVAVLPLSLR